MISDLLIFDALNGVLILLVLIAVGLVLAKAGFITEEMEHKLSQMTLLCFIPCSLFLNSYNYLTPELLKSLGHVLWLPLAAMLPGYFLSYPISNIFKIPKGNRGLFRVMFGLSNAIFIGMPVCQAIFGESSLPFVTVYFMSNTLMFWTLGVAGIASDGGKGYPLSWKIVTKIFSPPFIGAVLGAILGIAGVELPKFLSESIRYAGGMNVPVCLFVTGAILSRMGRGVFKLERTGVLVLAGRMVIQPGIMLGACLLFGAAGFAGGSGYAFITCVFALEAAMPVMNQSMLMAKVYGANSNLAAQMLTVSTLLAIIWIPVCVVLIGIIL